MSTFVHMELSTSDVDAAKAFYQAIFGWQYHDMDMPTGSYTIVMSGEQSIGGMQANPMPDAPNGWLGYVGVESVARTQAEIERLGGKVLLPEMDVGGMGKLAIFTDPQGALFAIWEAVMPAAAEPPPSEKQTRKKASKKASAKKAAVKKAPAKKAPAKQAPAKQAAAKKAPAKKAPAKQASAKKAPAKKAPAKKAPAKKAGKK